MYMILGGRGVVLLIDLSCAPQHHPDTGGHHYSEWSELEYLPGGHDGKEDVCKCQEGNTHTHSHRCMNFLCVKVFCLTSS